jgi:HlyD family secretion protein
LDGSEVTHSRFNSSTFAILIVAVLVCLLAGTTYRRRPGVDSSLTVTVLRGPLTARLTATGILKPARSITYRSPLAGREAEIIELAAEGMRVNEGDLIVRLDPTDLQREVERARQDVRQAELEVQVATIDRQEAEAALTAVSEGEGALTLDETRARLHAAEQKVERLREEFEQLKPLMEKGFMTRDELKKTADELEHSEQEAALARKRADVVIRLSYPRDRQRAALQLAQKESALANARTKAAEAQARLKQLGDQVEAASIYARRPGLVVYEEFLNAGPRRKIRTGDRVTSSQGIVTIPEVDRMLLEASVSEAEVHRVRSGQPAVVRVEAFPGVRLSGTVARVGTLARSSGDRPFEDKRFDLIVELDGTSVDLRPEMSARADIIVGTRSDVLLLPTNAIFEQHGQLVAHVLGPAGPETRAVTIGESSDVMVELLAGVREGERVMLTDPGRAAAVPPRRSQPAVDRAGRSPSSDKGADPLQPR